MRGRLQAWSATGLTALLALLWVPLSWPVSYLSGAAVGLVTLVQGPREGLFNALGAALLVGLLSLAIFGSPVLALAFALVVWLPAWLAAYTLRATVSLSAGVLVVAALAVMVVAAVYLLSPAPAAFWQHYFTAVALPAMQQAGVHVQGGGDLETDLGRISRIMTGMSAAFALVGTGLALFIARWWQALLYNPRGFREEFQRLRLGSVAAWAAVGVAVLGLASSGTVAEFAGNLFPLAVVLFLFQGLAVAHGTVAASGAHSGWIIGLYALLLIMPQTLLLLSAAGFIDNWIDFRARLRRDR